MGRSPYTGNQQARAVILAGIGLMLALASGCSWTKPWSTRSSPGACCGDPNCRCMQGGPTSCGCGRDNPEVVVAEAIPKAPVAKEVVTARQRPAQPERILHMPRPVADEPAPAPLVDRPAAEAPRPKPELVVSKSGPGRRYVGKTVEHVIEVRNEGTAPATGVVVTDHLPAELKLADRPPDAEVVGRDILWRIEQLLPGASRTFGLRTRAEQIAEHVLNRVTVSCREGLQAEGSAVLEIVGLAALRLEVFDLAGSVCEGEEAEYVLRVTNQGTTAAQELSLSAAAPPELKPVAASGIADEAVQGQAVEFPAFELSPSESRTFRLRLQGMHAGDARLKVSLAGRDLDDPVVEEESTTVCPPVKAAKYESSPASP
jgi:uncharacterized repeat protein (TIGR01451 family)